MNGLSVEPVVTDGFGIEPALSDGTLVVTLTGTGDMAAAARLKSYVKELEGEVARLSVGSVEFDVRGVRFMSSSCIKAFVGFICGVSGRGPKCRVRFVTDAQLTWQRRSLKPLDRMCPGLVSIDDA
ncbi:STAS domain-containing protein [Sorangium sp. So ce1335]|uniref:STAS domain-containing protein n=1 Tax=Sorangium sp. So ce1335 TaxID=3133335 RepID=UPI003F628D95